jgi:hypothetical protein
MLRNAKVRSQRLHNHSLITAGFRFGNKGHQHRPITGVLDRTNILENKSVRLGLDHKSNEVSDKRPSVVASRLLWGWRTWPNDTVRTVSSPSGILTCLHPVRRLAERLAWRPTNNHERLSLRQPRSPTQVDSLEICDVGVHNLMDRRCVLLERCAGDRINLD